MAATPGVIPAGAYWNEIQLAAQNRAGTAAVWQAISVAHLEATGSVPRFQFGEVNRLYALAAGNRRAAEALNAAAPGIQIGPEHIGAIPNAPPAPPGNISRRFAVRFEQQILRGGVTSSVWRTSIFQYGVPATKQSLINRLHRDAAIFSEDYEDETHLGIGDISILAA